MNYYDWIRIETFFIIVEKFGILQHIRVVCCLPGTRIKIISERVQNIPKGRDRPGGGRCTYWNEQHRKRTGQDSEERISDTRQEFVEKDMEDRECGEINSDILKNIQITVEEVLDILKCIKVDKSQDLIRCTLELYGKLG
eukprot:g45524.t1